jgi:hypothetical protein
MIPAAPYDVASNVRQTLPLAYKLHGVRGDLLALVARHYAGP